MHHYPFSPGDYLRDTAHLTDAEDLAYRRLLDRYYLDEGPLPEDAERAARLVRMAPDVVATVLSEFFELQVDGWHHKRCDSEIDKFRMRTQSARNANAMRWQCVSDPNQNQNQNHKPEPDKTKIKRERAAQRKRRAPLPDDFSLTEEMRQYALTRFPDIDTAATFAAFVDHHRNAGTLGLDWLAAWRTWVRNGERFGYARSKRREQVAPAEIISPWEYANRQRNRQPDGSAGVHPGMARSSAGDGGGDDPARRTTGGRRP